MLFNKLANYDVVLASGSPRRKQLLEELGLEFRIEVKPIVESYPSSYPIEKVAQYISEFKAAAFNTIDLKKNTLIITADTIVVLNNVILGKPVNKDEARLMLKSLSGEKHRVITGVTLRTYEKRHSFNVSTYVVFKELSDEEIEYYIDNFKPFDKAGGYGIQEWIGHAAIEKIEGSYFNVMGLPTHRLYEELIKFVGDKKYGSINLNL